MRVRDVMRHRLDAIEARASLVQAALQMRRRNTDCLCVCAEDRVIGWVTERDIVFYAVSQARDCVATSVREVMSRSCLHCREDDDLDEVIRRMHREGMQRMLVVCGDGRLRGVVTMAECGQWIGEGSETTEREAGAASPTSGRTEGPQGEVEQT